MFLQELGVVLQEEQQKIPRAEMSIIIFSMPDTCRAVGVARGGHI